MTNRICVLLLSVLALEAVARAPFPDLTTTAFQDQCLTKTNYFRALHQNTPSLTTDPNVVNYAKSRCQQVSRKVTVDLPADMDKIYTGLPHQRPSLLTVTLLLVLGIARVLATATPIQVFLQLPDTSPS